MMSANIKTVRIDIGGFACEIRGRVDLTPVVQAISQCHATLEADLPGFGAGDDLGADTKQLCNAVNNRLGSGFQAAPGPEGQVIVTQQTSPKTSNFKVAAKPNLKRAKQIKVRKKPAAPDLSSFETLPQDVSLPPVPEPSATTESTDAFEFVSSSEPVSSPAAEDIPPSEDQTMDQSSSEPTAPDVAANPRKRKLRIIREAPGDGIDLTADLPEDDSIDPTVWAEQNPRSAPVQSALEEAQPSPADIEDDTPRAVTAEPEPATPPTPEKPEDVAIPEPLMPEIAAEDSKNESPESDISKALAAAMTASPVADPTAKTAAPVDPVTTTQTTAEDTVREHLSRALGDAMAQPSKDIPATAQSENSDNPLLRFAESHAPDTLQDCIRVAAAYITKHNPGHTFTRSDCLIAAEQLSKNGPHSFEEKTKAFGALTREGAFLTSGRGKYVLSPGEQRRFM